MWLPFLLKVWPILFCLTNQLSQNDSGCGWQLHFFCFSRTWNIGLWITTILAGCSIVKLVGVTMKWVAMMGLATCVSSSFTAVILSGQSTILVFLFYFCDSGVWFPWPLFDYIAGLQNFYTNLNHLMPVVCSLLYTANGNIGSFVIPPLFFLIYIYKN